MSIQTYNDLYSRYRKFWSYEEFAELWIGGHFRVYIEKNKKYNPAMGWDWIKQNRTDKDFISDKNLYDDIVEFCNKETIYELFKYNEHVYIGETHIEEQCFEEKTYESDSDYEHGDEENYLSLLTTNYDCNVCLRCPQPNQLYMFSESIVGICKKCWRQGYRFNHDGTKIFTSEGNNYEYTNINYYPDSDYQEEKEEEEDYESSENNREYEYENTVESDAETVILTPYDSQEEGGVSGDEDYLPEFNTL